MEKSIPRITILHHMACYIKTLGQNTASSSLDGCHDWPGKYQCHSPPSVLIHMGLDAAKPVFRVSDKARLKPVSSATETS